MLLCVCQNDWLNFLLLLLLWGGANNIYTQQGNGSLSLRWEANYNTFNDYWDELDCVDDCVPLKNLFAELESDGQLVFGFMVAADVCLFIAMTSLLFWLTCCRQHKPLRRTACLFPCIAVICMLVSVGLWWVLFVFRFSKYMFFFFACVCVVCVCDYPWSRFLFLFFSLGARKSCGSQISQFSREGRILKKKKNDITHAHLDTLIFFSRCV